MKIFKGRTEPCKNGLGGVKSIYLFNYNQATAEQRTGKWGVSLTSYPATVVYEYEVTDASFSEDRADDLGDWSQSLTATIFKQSVTDSLEVDKLMGLELGVIILGRDGLYRLMGAENGVRLENVTAQSGTNHASLNGYSLTFTGLERFKTPLFESLSSVGFGLDSGSNYLLSEIFEILTDGSNSLIYA